ncbi:hypothetical protein [Limnobacter alexandrii]|jgi:ABC-type thiamin/hydroxymethylpyrimidine transport system permease subunit|uniref:hypothetical protein n=1 Tax=Limnobacter alexandrii TaxID=2570352 RepID=UPI00110813E1|nr:hypothetical protein [Limnobacter alexandrii]
MTIGPLNSRSNWHEFWVFFERNGIAGLAINPNTVTFTEIPGVFDLQSICNSTVLKKVGKNVIVFTEILAITTETPDFSQFESMGIFSTQGQ